VVLEKNQGVFIFKNPVSNEIEILKMETKSKKRLIKVILANSASGFFGADSKITIKEQFPSVFFGVRSGFAKIVKNDRTYNLLAGDYYEAMQNLLE
jgi:hypothetical protein